MADTTQVSEQQKKNEVALLDFVQKLLDERKDPKIKPEDVPAARSLLLQEVHEHINRALIRALTDLQQIELGKFLDTKPDGGGLDMFFEQKIEDMDVVIARALLEFRNAYLAPKIDLNSVVQGQVEVKKEEPKKEDFSMPLPAPVR
jgi:hypothetical protein